MTTTPRDEKIIDISSVILEMGLDQQITEQQRAVINHSLWRAEGAIKRYLKYDPTYATRTERYPQFDILRLYREGIWDIQGNQAVLQLLSENAHRDLQLRHIPIRSVTSLYINYDGRYGTKDGVFGADDLKVEGEDFWPAYDTVDDDGNNACLDGILKARGRWPMEQGSIQITYTAGYTPEELHGQRNTLDASPIVDAVINETVRRAQKIFTGSFSSLTGGSGFVPGPIVSERLGDYSYTLGGSGSRGTSVDRRTGGASDLLPETREMLADFVNWGWPIAS